MKSKGYTTIFILLSFCILAILIMQGFWIHHFYQQKKDEFSKTVYQSLGLIADKLNERENIHIIKRSFDADSILLTEDILGVSDEYEENSKSNPRIKIINRSSTSTLSAEGRVIISDSVMQINGNCKSLLVSKSLKSKGAKKEELDKLVGKMMMEIKSLDLSLTDSIHKDTLGNLIRKQLAYKGIFTPVEFSLNKRENAQDLLLAKSDNFDRNTFAFKADLASNHVFSNPYILSLQFPSQTEFVFSGMKNVLILSALFSFLILGIFYFTVRTILKQKRISEMKNDFINNMTHELKTPIATISLAVDSLNSPGVRQDDTKFNTYSKILKEENQKMNKQVERVLEIAQLDKGTLLLDKKPVNISDVIESVVSSYSLLITEKNAVVKITPCANCVISGDQVHLSTVFSNLIDNALKYCGDSCLIEITVGKKEGNLEVRIKDNGIGIEKHLQNKIFEKFYRVQGGNLHDVKGFGLGLSYVKSIVEAHEGKINLVSEKNKGSEFILTFKSYAG